MTVIEAVLQVMRAAGRPMSPREVLSEIQRSNLYAFRAREPASIVQAAMRRHSIDCPPAIASSVASLKLIAKDSYALLPTPMQRSADREVR